MENYNSIWVTTQKEGYHKWANAPDEVDFLRNTHRHIFYITTHCEVFHEDRELEFFMFKRDLEYVVNDVWDRKGLNKQSSGVGMSCEMIADSIYDKLSQKYQKRDMTIIVSEDNENGCNKVYPKKS